MEHNLQNGILTVTLNVRIDSKNASDTEKELFGIINENSPSSIILDAADMEYISSAGLRVILKVKKHIASSEIVNVSPNIYEIFQMTGFTDIINVKKAFREISVEGCEIIGAGAHGTVYRLDGDSIVKVYNEKEPLSAIEREIEYARSAFVLGVPTAIPFDVVKCGCGYGAVFELINAVTLSKALNSSPENYTKYSQKYTRLIQQLHNTECDTRNFVNIKSLYHQWADEMIKYFSAEEIEKLHSIVESVPDRKTLVHGDIHPNNIMLQDGELVIIDMAALTYGHPVFDYAGMALSHILSGAGGANLTKRIIGIEYPMALSLWNDLTKSDFSGRTEKELKVLNDILIGFGWVKYSLAPALNKNQDPNITEALLKKSHEYFFPSAKRLVGAVNF